MKEIILGYHIRNFVIISYYFLTEKKIKTRSYIFKCFCLYMIGLHFLIISKKSKGGPVEKTRK